MADIFETKITASNIRQIWESNTNIPPFMGEMFFPATSQLGLELNLIKGKNGIPVALVASNWDTNVLYRDRIGFEALQAELPYFKEAYKVSEKLRQKILTAQDQFRGAFFTQIFNDIQDLLLGAEVTVERMRMQILGIGTISIVENGVDKQYDYGFDISNKFKTEATLWSANGANPIKSVVAQIKNYKRLHNNTAPKYAVFGVDAFEKLINDSTVDSYFQALAIPNLYPTDEERKAYVESRLGLTILVNDMVYVEARDTTKTPVNYYPADRYTLLSTLDLGETVYGTTPEEIDLLNGGNSNVLSGEVIGNGVAVTTWKDVDPVCVNTKVSEVVAPSCPNIDTIYIVKVL